MTPMQALAGAIVLGAAALVLAASPYDAQILMRLRHPDVPAEALGPVWLQESIRDITALGSNTVLAIVLLLAALTLGLLGKVRRAGAVVVSAAGALATVNLLKSVFARDRPDVLSELLVLSASFPSSPMR
jgi:undecaprenyl-diphosphatase